MNSPIPSRKFILNKKPLNYESFIVEFKSEAQKLQYCRKTVRHEAV
jgi:hypothetical protein